MTDLNALKPLVVALLMCFVATPCAAENPRPDSDMDAYAKPGQLVDVGKGRRLNLRCSGKGSPTVLLESGNNADSMTWSKVQPQVARFARVCAYDRAGTGFSDGGPLPRNLDVNAEDLSALIHAAHIATPAVLVGHSYGTNVVRRFADNHAAEVAALVLLDPPPQNVGEFSPVFEKADEEQRLGMQARVGQCQRAAEEGKLDAPPPELKDCLRPPNPQFSAALNAAIHANKTRPAFWQTIISLSEANGELYKHPVDSNESHGGIPLLILQPDAPFADVPQEIQKPMEQARLKTQQAIALTSTRSTIMPVAHSSHDVQLDRPDAVVEAVRAAIAIASEKSRHDLPIVDAPKLFAPEAVWPAGSDASPAFTPDGRTVFFTHAVGTVRTIVVSHFQDGAWSKPETAPFSGIWRDIEPAMAPDGSYLVFISNRPETPGGEPLTGYFGGAARPGAGGNIWRVNRKGRGWGVPVRLPTIVNSQSAIYSPAVAQDGSLYLNHPDPITRKTRLYRAQATADGFLEPVPLSFTDGVTSDYDAAVAPDESFIVFSSNRAPSTPGQSMIFISYASKGQWTEPQILQPPTSGLEARLSPDLKTLYFSADAPLPNLNDSAGGAVESRIFQRPLNLE